MSTNKNVNYILCPTCDLLMEISFLFTGKEASYPRCSYVFVSNWYEPYRRHNICALSTFVLLVFSNIFPIVNINFAGINNQILLNQIPHIMANEGYTILATFFVLVIQFIPLYCIIIIFLLVNPTNLSIEIKLFLAKTFF
ncbi:paraquat-inducible protein A [Candidatus Pantoea edessiphila]|uniref:paraquat-inducible protein A n=1 Tax=Candidatus Pantoea edessiphila TaxID=2044610 RepID=UPI002410F559|nr:paraquat-inducible protein A [Candidatus Pantoea edessiphila]